MDILNQQKKKKVKKIISFLIIGIFLFSIIALAVAEINNQQTAEVKTISSEWTIYQSLSENYTIDIKDKNKQKSEICFWSKTAEKIQDLESHLLINTNVGEVQLNTKQEQDPIIQSLKRYGYCRVVDDETEIQFNPTLVYQDQQYIEYNSNNIQINTTLKKWNGEDFVIAPQDVWIYETNNSFKFGGNDTVSKEDGVYKYTFESSEDINQDSHGFYISEKSNIFTFGVQKEREYIDLKDICTEGNCSYNLKNNTLEVIFTAFYNSEMDMVFIDPSFAFSNDFSKNSLNIDTITEPNNVHLEIDSTSERELVLDGDGDYISYPSKVLTNGKGVSYVAWFKTPDLTTYRPVIRNGGATVLQSGYDLWVSNNGQIIVSGSYGNSSTANFYGTTPLSYDDNLWHLMVLSWNGSVSDIVKFYIDGVNVYNRTASVPSTSLTINTDFQIGSHTTSHFNGSIDEVMVFDRALSSSEIIDIYSLNRSTYNGSTVGLVGKWTFDDYLNNFKDSSGTGNDGTGNGNAKTQIDSNYPQNAPYSNLVGYWNFDGDCGNNSETCSPTTSYDLTNLNNDGTYNGTAYVSNSSGIYDNALVLDGDGDYVTATKNLNIAGEITSSHTLCAWFNPNAIIDLSGISLSNNYRMRLITRSMGWGYQLVAGVSTVVHGGSVDVGSWQHVCAVYNSSSNKTTVYKNANAGTPTLNNYVNTSLSTAGINIGLSQAYYNGSIDEVMVFDKALSSTEISNIYNNQSNRFKETGTVKLKQTTLNSTYGGYDQVTLNISNEKNGGTSFKARLYTWFKTLGYCSPVEDVVDYWTMDEATFVDNSGYGSNVTSVGNVTVGQGVYNNSAQFNGSNYLDTLFNGTQYSELSMTAWIKNNNAEIGDFQYILDNSPASTGFMLRAYTDEKVSLYVYDGSGAVGVTATSPIVTNQWNFVSFTASPTSLKIYINGVLSNSLTKNHSNILPSNDLMMIGGNLEGSSRWNGSIDDVVAFNRTLTSAEIKELYLKGLVVWNKTTWQTITDSEAVFVLPDKESTNIYPELRLITTPTTKFYTPFVYNTSMSYDLNMFDVVNPEINTNVENLQTFYISSGEGITMNLIYNVTEDNFESANYSIFYPNGTTIKTNSSSGQNEIYSFNTTKLGLYRWDIFANDTYGNNNSKTVFFLIDIHEDLRRPSGGSSSSTTQVINETTETEIPDETTKLEELINILKEGLSDEQKKDIETKTSEWFESLLDFLGRNIYWIIPIFILSLLFKSQKNRIILTDKTKK